MPRDAERGLIEYANTAPSADMRFFAAAAIEQKLSLRDLAARLGVAPSTVTRHMRAGQSKPETVARYTKALGFANRAGRVARGPMALSAGDLRHFREMLLRTIATSDEYRDFADAVHRVASALDGCKDATQREVLHRFAETGDQRAAVSLLATRTKLMPPATVHFAASDASFWTIALELSDLGLPSSDRNAVLDVVRCKLGRDSEAVRRNDAYLESSVFGALVGHDGERAASARAAFHSTNPKTENEL